MISLNRFVTTPHKGVYRQQTIHITTRTIESRAGKPIVSVIPPSRGGHRRRWVSGGRAWPVVGSLSRAEGIDLVVGLLDGLQELGCDGVVVRALVKGY